MYLHPRPVLHTLGLAVDGRMAGVDTELLNRIFPTVRVNVTRSADADLDQRAWARPDFDLDAFDRSLDRTVDEHRPLVLRTTAPSASQFALQILTRAQRRIQRRNAVSRAPMFERVLAAHAGSSDRSRRPVTQADHDLSLDRWQWTLRLAPASGVEVQLAALLLALEAQPSRARGCRRGAMLREPTAAERFLEEARVEPEVRSAVRLLVAGAEGDPAASTADARTVADADALSFFSISSPGYVDFFGAALAARQIRAVIAKMSAAARAELPRIRLRADVGAMVSEVVGTDALAAVG